MNTIPYFFSLHLFKVYFKMNIKSNDLTEQFFDVHAQDNLNFVFNYVIVFLV